MLQCLIYMLIIHCDIEHDVYDRCKKNTEIWRQKVWTYNV